MTPELAWMFAVFLAPQCKAQFAHLGQPGGRSTAIYREPMDDGAWLPAPATWWGVRLKRPSAFATKKERWRISRSVATATRQRRDRL